jgi:hypothetical protein
MLFYGDKELTQDFHPESVMQMCGQEAPSDSCGTHWLESTGQETKELGR